MADEGNLARQAARRSRNQVGIAGKIDDFGGQSVRTGGAAVAQRGDMHRLDEGRRYRRGFFTADPSLHHEGLVGDLGEAFGAQPGHRPVARPRLGLGAGHPWADFGGDALDEIPGDGVGGERLFGLSDRGRFAGSHRGLGICGGREGGGGGKRDQEGSHGRDC